jgi:hypothetical protein
MESSSESESSSYNSESSSESESSSYNSESSSSESDDELENDDELEISSGSERLAESYQRSDRVPLRRGSKEWGRAQMLARKREREIQMIEKRVKDEEKRRNLEQKLDDTFWTNIGKYWGGEGTKRCCSGDCLRKLKIETLQSLHREWKGTRSVRNAKMQRLLERCWQRYTSSGNKICGYYFCLHVTTADGTEARICPRALQILTGMAQQTIDHVIKNMNLNRPSTQSVQKIPVSNWSQTYPGVKYERYGPITLSNIGDAF